MTTNGANERPKTRQLTISLPEEALHVLQRRAKAENMTTTSFVEARLGELVGFLRTKPKKPPVITPGKTIGYL